jgi:AraC-like DNA-binding protein
MALLPAATEQGMTEIPSVTFDSAAYPPGEGFDVWRSAIPVYDIALGPGIRNETFRAHGGAWFLGDLVLTRTTVSPLRMRRTPDRIRADGVDNFIFFALTAGSASGDFDGRAASFGAGQIVGVDLSRPFETLNTEDSSLALSVTRMAMGSAEPTAPGFHGNVFSGPSADMLFDHLLSLERHLPSLQLTDVPSLNKATLALLSFAVATIPRPAEVKAGALAIRHAAQRFIEQHLHEPDLSAAAIAAALSVTRTRLYRGFETLGGVAAYIQRRRLEAVRALVCHPDETRSIAELAKTFGFVNASHFAAAFKRAYGISATEAREKAAVLRLWDKVEETDEATGIYKQWSKRLQTR